MLRILAIAALIVAFAQTRGVMLFGDDCDETDCGDTCDFGKHCPPECPTCTCAAPSTPTMATVYATLTPPIRTASAIEFVDRQAYVPSPDPREILHVPRPLAI